MPSPRAKGEPGTIPAVAGRNRGDPAAAAPPEHARPGPRFGVVGCLPGTVPAGDRVAPYRAKTGGSLSGENAWLPMTRNRGTLSGES